MNHESLKLGSGRVLIANRGEIAVRVIRALRELGLTSIAVYSDADENSGHRALADEACRMSGTLSKDTYLNIDRLIRLARAAKVDAIHPGYGFLSENAEFCSRAREAGMIFIGPTPEAIRAMGDKVQAKDIMRRIGVPVTPGSKGVCENLKDVEQVIAEIGFPLILKAAAGGGGRGMQIITKPAEVKESFERCQREALAYFGNGAVFCERLILKPRHVEIQVIRDQHGKAAHLFERDCTVQRRHQKLLEEAPSTYLSPAMREKLGAWAVAAADAVDYHGAGTVEFICEAPDKAYFMEMNTRIQVEHPVTEMVTGIDLIKEQIRIAGGKPLSFRADEVRLHGHAIEVRINAEDPEQNFRPSSGRIERLVLPRGPFVRVDTHISEGYEVPEFYDSMIAKFIVWGRDRDEAIGRMRAALSEFVCQGIKTTARFHERLLDHASFRSGEYSTKFLEERGHELTANPEAAFQLSKEEAPLPWLVAARLAEGEWFRTLPGNLAPSASKQQTAQQPQAANWLD